jgi:hypothetical protein
MGLRIREAHVHQRRQLSAVEQLGTHTTRRSARRRLGGGSHTRGRHLLHQLLKRVNAGLLLLLREESSERVDGRGAWGLACSGCLSARGTRSEQRSEGIDGLRRGRLARGGRGVLSRLLREERSERVLSGGLTLPGWRLREQRSEGIYGRHGSGGGRRGLRRSCSVGCWGCRGCSLRRGRHGCCRRRSGSSWSSAGRLAHGGQSRLHLLRAPARPGQYFGACAGLGGAPEAGEPPQLPCYGTRWGLAERPEARGWQPSSAARRGSGRSWPASSRGSAASEHSGNPAPSVSLARASAI